MSSKTVPYFACVVTLLFSMGCDAVEPVAPPPKPLGSELETNSPSSNVEFASTSVSDNAANVDTEAKDLWTRKVGHDWPTFLGPQANGHSSEKGILTDWSDGKLKVVWTKPLGTSYGIGAVSRGRYLQFDRFGDNERLTCFNAETGEELWQWESPVEYEDMYGYNNGPRTSPVIDGERVFVYGVTGTLACLQLADGKLLWKKSINQEYGVIQNFFGVGSTPIVHRDLLILQVGGSPREQQSLPIGRLDLVRGNGSAIVAFDKATGKEVYRFSDELASYSVPIVAKINGVDVGLAFTRGGLIGFDPAKGASHFFFPWRSVSMESVNAAVPVIRENEVLISETYSIGSTLLKLESLEQPKVVWQDPAQQRNQAFRAHWATPVLVGDYLYGCSGRNQPDAEFRCVKWSTGEVMWRVRNHERTSVLAVDGHIVVLGEEGGLQLIRANPEKFDLVSSVDFGSIVSPKERFPLLNAPCWAAPILSHGLMYVRGADRVLCLELIPEATTK